MVFFNYTTMQITAKIVYYGPGLCGKTTNLHWIHGKTAPRSRGEMVSLETETDRTLFFDLLPLDVGVIGGMRVRLQEPPPEFFVVRAFGPGNADSRIAVVRNRYLGADNCERLCLSYVDPHAASSE